MQRHDTLKQRAGFTLLEMSIVLVVIGLLIGGVMAGESMVRSSELRNTVSQIARYSEAVKNFQDKYTALPGDFNGAEAIWNGDNGCPEGAFTDKPHFFTCNGNGNGHIGDVDTDGGTTNNEWFRAWQQLANAQMIDGGYNGISDTGANYLLDPGKNIPAAGIGGGFVIYYRNLPSGNAAFWPMPIGHYMALCLDASSGATTGYCDPGLRPSEALAIDQKIDDGLPAGGNIFSARPANFPNCVTNIDATLAQYDTTQHLMACPLLTYMNF